MALVKTDSQVVALLPENTSLVELIAEHDYLRNIIVLKNEAENATDQYHQQEIEWYKKQLKEKEEYWEKEIASLKIKLDRQELDNSALRKKSKTKNNTKQIKMDADLRHKLIVSEKKRRIAEDRNEELLNELDCFKKHMEEEVGKGLEREQALERAHERALEQALNSVKDSEDRLSKEKLESIEKLEKQMKETDMENKMAVHKLRRIIEEKDEFIQEEEENKKRLRFDNLVKYKRLEMNAESLKETIAALKLKEDLAPKVAKLKADIKEKDRIIRHKNVEMAALKKEKKAIQDLWGRQKDTNAILIVKLRELRDNNACQEDENRNLQGQLKIATEGLDKAKRVNTTLNESVTLLKSKVKACEPDLNHLREQVKKLVTYQGRFKGDLLECSSVINDPQKLKRKVITLKRCYIDEDKHVQMDEKSKISYQHQAACLRTRYNNSEKSKQVQSKAIKRVDGRLEDSFQHLEQTRSFYIKLLNEKIVEIHTLKKELTQTTLLLQEASKPTHQKLQNWMKKRVLKTRQAALEALDEPLFLYKDDLQLPDLLNDDDMSSVHSCMDDISSSSQPHPCTDDESSSSQPRPCTNDLSSSSHQRPGHIVINVSPVDDALPPVDI